MSVDFKETAHSRDEVGSETVISHELDAARKIRDGDLPTPYKFANVWLFNIRITGTGTSYRSRGDEFVYRAPEHYLNDEFLARCNGLPVIWEHPEKGVLNSEEYKNRNIGTIFLPYVKNDEVWGIAKVFDDDAAMLMEKNILSTSPTVWFTKQDGNATIKLKDNSVLLIEGVPSLLDHVAICEQGVWDKGGDPMGVAVSDSVNFEGNKMDEDMNVADKAKVDAEEMKAKADATEKEEFQKKFDAMMSAVDSLTKKVDSMCEAKGEPKEVVADEKEKEEAKADSEEIRKRIDSVEKMVRSLSDADIEALADAQAKADSVANAFGQSVTKPMLGEAPLNYRKRVANKFKSHSAKFKDIDLAKIADDSLFSIVEQQIYSDAIVAANSPVADVGGGLREIKTRSPAGHQISTFKGPISAWMDNFKADSFKVTQLNTGAK